MLDRRTFLTLGAVLGIAAPGARAARATSIDVTLAIIQIIEVDMAFTPVDVTLQSLVTYGDIKPKLIQHTPTRLKDAGTGWSVVDFSTFVEPRDVYPEQMIIADFRLDLQRTSVEGRPVILGAVGVLLVQRGTDATGGVPVVHTS